jgi:hypothetical protein
VSTDVPPGSLGTFDVALDATQAGTFTVELGLIAEGVTWFADPTLGGGPADGTLRVALVVVALDAGSD